MLLSEILRGAQIGYDGADREIGRVTYDSRTATADAMFVCIRGFSGDGHAFAPRAYALGCRVFLAVEPLDLPADASVIYTDNTRAALARVAAAFYGFPAKKLKIIGITGTKGKTTTAQMLTAVLNGSGIPTGYIGTSGMDFAGTHYETKNTTPESLDLHSYFAQMVGAGIKAAVIEVSSQALYLDRVLGIEFEAVAFTNLAPDHIGGVEHPTFEHYRDCKKKLFTAYPSRYAIFNAEDAHTAYMMDGCRAAIGTFGLSAGDFHAEGIEPFLADGTLGVRFTLCHLGRRYPAKLPMPGDFSVQNALCAAALAFRMGVPVGDAVTLLAGTAARGRFEVVNTSLPAVFVIDYAHNGFSLASALGTLRAYHPRKLYCLTGSVGGRTQSRRAEIGEVISRLADEVVLTADNPDFEDPMQICADIRAAFVCDIPCSVFADRAEAIRFVAGKAGRGDVVLLAGKGHEQYQLIRGERVPFSERRILEQYAMEIAMV